MHLPQNKVCLEVMPAAYLPESYVLHAKKLLLSTDRTIREIARDYGSSQSSCFIHCFKKVLQVMPELFRISWDS